MAGRDRPDAGGHSPEAEWFRLTTRQRAERVARAASDAQFLPVPNTAPDDRPTAGINAGRGERATSATTSRAVSLAFEASEPADGSKSTPASTRPLAATACTSAAPRASAELGEEICP